MDFNNMQIGDHFEQDGKLYILTDKSLDNDGQLVGISFQPVTVSE